MSEYKVRGTEWTERNDDSDRREHLIIHGSDEIAVPITNIDHHDFPTQWDANTVYVIDGDLVVEGVDKGVAWAMYQDEESPGPLGWSGQTDLEPIDPDQADTILWERNPTDTQTPDHGQKDHDDLMTDGGTDGSDTGRYGECKKCRFVADSWEDARIHIRDSHNRLGTSRWSPAKVFRQSTDTGGSR